MQNTKNSCDEKLGIGRQRIRKIGSGNFLQWFSTNNDFNNGGSWDETVNRYEKTCGCRISARERKKFSCDEISDRASFGSWWEIYARSWNTFEDNVALYEEEVGCKIS